MRDEDKLGYQTAIQLATYEGKIIWSSFQALITANAFLVALISVIDKVYQNQTGAKNILAVLGFIMCICWALLIMRNFDHYKYWFAWARYFESKDSTNSIKITTEGKRYSKGEKVTINSDLHVEMRWPSKFFRAEWLMLIIIAVFAYLYYSLLKM